MNHSEQLKLAKAAVIAKERWVFCHCCNCFHPVKFNGDCRDDKNRLPVLPSDFLDESTTEELLSAGITDAEATQLVNEAWDAGL